MGGISHFIWLQPFVLLACWVALPYREWKGILKSLPKNIKGYKYKLVKNEGCSNN
jgi:hypothetical protein